MAKRSFLASKILCYILSCFCASYCLAADTLYQGGDALNSSGKLVSKNGLFTLGFVRIGSDEVNASYLGIWYNSDDTSTIHPFWLANRDKAIADNSGVLAIDGRGNMKLTYSGGDLVSFYSSQSSTTNITAVLEDSGNFVLKDANSGSNQTLWQSFDHPTDTFLPGMKLGIDHRTNKTWSLTSWLSDVVPASGAFTFEWEPNGQELTIKRRGEIHWTSGSLTRNNTFQNFWLNSGLVYSFLNVSKADEDYFEFTADKDKFGPQDGTKFSRWNLQFSGSIIDQSNGQTFGGTSCDGNSTEMGCKRWDVEPKCNRGKRKNYNLFAGGFGPMFPYEDDYNASLSISDCIDICWKNCSCTGVDSRGSNYANRTGCIFWYGTFTQDPSGAVAGRYYIMDQETEPSRHDTKEEVWVWILAALGAVLIMALAGVLLYLRRRRLREKLLHELMTSDATNDVHELENDGNEGHNLEVYSAATIMAATNNFASENKLGQGGFGPVYKGKLPDGREIAVKRLSRSSGQGLVEFKNELILIAKLQHTNLVRLLGCCIQGEEKMLVYEYMPNKSLDSFIFVQSKRELLDWKKIFEIIEGIAHGLLYLHKYSRLRIIHRDLKAGNILLDENLNPKISDFGMARIFKKNEQEANTNRVVGTYGYMSPEYAMEGVFSVKSDVFSFGVLVLEIVSGRKIHGLLQMDGRPLNLVGYAWELWKAGTPFELVDPILRESCSKDQVLRCINVGLLCVEDSALDRPTMSDVISMLTSEAQLPLPKQPAFSNPRTVVDDAESSLSNLESSSRNYLSTSSMYGR